MESDKTKLVELKLGHVRDSLILKCRALIGMRDRIAKDVAGRWMSFSKLRVEVILCILLFLLVFGFWQVYRFIVLPSRGLLDFAYIVIQIACLGAFTLFVKVDKSTYREHGFRRPEDSIMQVSLSLSVVIIYFFITFSLPSLLMHVRVYTWKPVPLSQAFVEFVKALLTGLASEAVFRGYIQKNLTRTYKFLPALYISSLLFSIHNLNIRKLPLDYILRNTVSLFTQGVFLGFFFHRTDSLLGPVTFQTFLLFLYSITFIQPEISLHMKLFLELTTYILALFLVDAFIKKR